MKDRDQSTKQDEQDALGNDGDLPVSLDDVKKKKDKTKKDKKKKKETRDEKGDKKKKKKRDKRSEESDEDAHATTHKKQKTSSSSSPTSSPSVSSFSFRPLVESSDRDYDISKRHDKDNNDNNNVTLLLFYQYQEPPWSEAVYQDVLQTAQRIATQACVTGRMRVAKEGFNCTLTTTGRDGMVQLIDALRAWKPTLFQQTEFKLTHHLPAAQAFKDLKIIPVQELVHYGLEGAKAPPIMHYHGQHLEPKQYHAKMTQPDTVMIDVRNHYEAQIGRFDPPAATWVDPNMRKSTEFPAWLDSADTREKLRGKQVLMYCTGGIRCERATALLKYKMETDPAVQELGIQGVYQLQGGIDKYFKEFPDGGYWKGKNYVFDKRFAHQPPAQQQQKQHTDATISSSTTTTTIPLSKCEACQQPWDKFRGKRRCPTCGVPSLICKACWQAHQDGTRKIAATVRCDLCVAQGITSKHDWRQKERQQILDYEQRMQAKGLLEPAAAAHVHDGGNERAYPNQQQQYVDTETTSKMPPAADNPDQITRLVMRNLCRKRCQTAADLLHYFPDMTHIIWRTNHHTQQFLGTVWVEMASPEAAAQAVARSGERLWGRPVQIAYQPPNGKDIWPPPQSAVEHQM